MEMIFRRLVLSTILVLPGVLAGENCTKFANTAKSYRYFCSGHCCGTPVGDECCFDGIAQIFTVIACVLVFCLLLFFIAYFVIGKCITGESKSKVEPQEHDGRVKTTEDPVNLESGETSLEVESSHSVPEGKPSDTVPEGKPSDAVLEGKPSVSKQEESII